MGKISHFECTTCGEKLDSSRPQTVCPRDRGMLLARYKPSSVHPNRPEHLAECAASMWRYAELLPAASSPITLGEGWTPLLQSHNKPRLWIKNESANPTGSVEDRGMAVAVSALRNYGVQTIAIASTGDSAASLSAYCTATGLKAIAFIPRNAALANKATCASYGAEMRLLGGGIGDCERAMRESTAHQDCFALADACEPYRIEGCKTIGFEIVEQLGWRVPDAIVVPTGAGIELLGIWKALQEMEALGWIGAKRPRLIAVQAAGCAPIVQAFAANEAKCSAWSNPRTIASELCSASLIGGPLVLKALRESRGIAVAVSDEEMLVACSQLARNEGVFAAPEGGAVLAAYTKLRATGLLREGDEVVMVNTRSGLKCPEVFESNQGAVQKPLPKSHSLGGIIQPY